MGALSNPRHERFARLLVKGLPPYRAYPQAGYNVHNGSPYRLRDYARVQARVNELQKAAAMRTTYTVESLTEELEEARKLAMTIEQPGAAHQAIMGKAKLLGLIIDKQELKHGDIETSDMEQLQAAADQHGITLDRLMELIGCLKPAPPEPTHDAPESTN